MTMLALYYMDRECLTYANYYILYQTHRFKSPAHSAEVT